MSVFPVSEIQEILNITPQGANWDTVYGSLIAAAAALLGAFIGGHFTLKSADKAHKHNLELAQINKREQERVTISSLMEELNVLIECYQPEFEALFATLDNQKYLSGTYNVTQEYFTVYKNNADKLGLIQNPELRNLFIKIHILLSRFIEDLIIYDKVYREMLQRRVNFLSKVNSDSFDTDLYHNFDVSSIIRDIKIDKNNFLRKISKTSDRIKFNQYLINDTAEENVIHEKCVEMKELFYKIVNTHKNIKDIIDKEYQND